jgi:uncharacterized surface protein with fasciclin (FAS1) repeats
MKQSSYRLSALTAAIALALGSGAALAQEVGDEQEHQQTSQEHSQTSIDDSRSSGIETAAETESSEGSGKLSALSEEHSDLSTFVEAVQAAGMEDALTDGTAYTVFAPTDDAFDEMSGKSVDELLAPENREELISTLRAHIVADDVDSDTAGRIGAAQTIDGGEVDLQMSEDQELMVGNATATDSPIEFENLTVYRIDGVLESSAGRAASL